MVLKCCLCMMFWCGELPLKTSFSELFTIACGKDVWVADNMQLQNGNIQ